MGVHLIFLIFYTLQIFIRRYCAFEHSLLFGLWEMSICRDIRLTKKDSVVPFYTSVRVDSMNLERLDKSIPDLVNFVCQLTSFLCTDRASWLWSCSWALSLHLSFCEVLEKAQIMIFCFSENIAMSSGVTGLQVEPNAFTTSWSRATAEVSLLQAPHWLLPLRFAKKLAFLLCSFWRFQSVCAF